jgi:hypothetical protein
LNNIIETDVQTKATVLALPTSRATFHVIAWKEGMVASSIAKLKFLGMRKQ